MESAFTPEQYQLVQTFKQQFVANFRLLARATGHSDHAMLVVDNNGTREVLAFTRHVLLEFMTQSRAPDDARHAIAFPIQGAFFAVFAIPELQGVVAYVPKDFADDESETEDVSTWPQIADVKKPGGER